MKQKILKYSLTPIAVLAAVFLLNPVISRAAATLNVSATTGLTNGQVVSVSGAGFAANSTGSILECNSDPNQPTVSFLGNPIAVSCSNPFSALTSTDGSGNLGSTSFTIVSGTVGPPATGTDSSGGSASTDAAAYPCPPTQAQINAGYTCNLSFGDQAGDTAAQNISFAGQPSPQGSGSGSGSSGSSGSTTKKSTSTTTTTKSTTSTTPTTTTTTPTTQSSTESITASTASLSVAVDTKSARPIVGAKVTLDGKTSKTTDKNGLAVFQDVSSGKHTVTVLGTTTKTPTKTQVTLASGETKIVSVEIGQNEALVKHKSHTIYYVIAGIIVVLLGFGLVFLYLRNRPPKAISPTIPGAVSNSSSPSSVQTPTSPTIAQPTPQIINPSNSNKL